MPSLYTKTRSDSAASEVGPGVRVDLFGLIGRSTATASRKHQMCHSTDEHVLLVLGMAVYVWLWWWGQCVRECMRKDSTMSKAKNRSAEPS